MARTHTYTTCVYETCKVVVTVFRDRRWVCGDDFWWNLHSEASPIDVEGFQDPRDTLCASSRSDCQGPV